MDRYAYCCGLLLVLSLSAGIGIVWYIFFGKPAADAWALQNKFQSLGNLRGKTLEEVQKVLGPPRNQMSLSNNRSYYIWSTHEYHITLQFQGNICEGIFTETTEEKILA